MMLNRKLKGGALYIALIICIVIGIILGVFILIAHFNQRQVLARLGSEQLRWDLRSAFHIAQSQGFSDDQNNRWFQNGLNEDSIKLKTLQWGAYQLIEAQVKNSHQLLTETGLYGSYSPADTAFYAEDTGRPISLAGAVKFTAAVYVPSSGFRTAYIEGAGAVIDPSLNGHVRKAGGGLPAIKRRLAEQLTELLQHPETRTDSLGSLERQNITQPFSGKTLLIRSGNLNLSGYHLRHNIKLVANGEIVLDSSTHLDNVLLIAAKVRFKKGFKGTVQVLAGDSIILEEECHLQYPSSLTVIKYETEGSNLKGIFVGEKCRIEGSLIAVNPQNDNQKVLVSTKKECSIYGLVYSSNYASVQGELYGTLYCSRLLLQTPSAVYENHLLNCSIDPKKYRNSIFVPALFEISRARKCIKRL